MGLFSIAIAVAIGILFVSAGTTLRGMRPRWAAVVFAISLGTGLGIGFTAVVFFLLLAITNDPSPRAIICLDALSLLAAMSLSIRRKPVVNDPRVSTSAPWTRALAALFLITLAIIFTRLIQISIANPFGQWDAWAIWNVRAKYLAGPGTWHSALSPLLTKSHPDYPLLLSSFIARVWKSSGAATQLAPAQTTLLFTAALIGLLVSGTALLRSAISGLLAGFVLLSTLPFLWFSTSQYADIPLAFYLLAAFTLIFLDARTGSRAPWPLLCAGLCAGFAAWTKNEGTAFLVWILAVSFAAARRRSFLLLAGAAPGILLALRLKVGLAPPSDLAIQSWSATLAKLHDPSRYVLIVRWFARDIYHLGTGVGHPVVLLTILILALRWQIEERYKLPIAITAISLGLMLLTDVSVYLITPHDLAWHLETSMDRLIVQLWPSFLLLFFAVLQSYAPNRKLSLD